MNMGMDNVNQKILLNLQNNVAFLEECQKVKEKIKQAGVLIREDKKTGTFYIKNFGLKEKLLTKEPYRIAGYFKLPSEWSVSIRLYILTGELKLPPLQDLWLFNKDSGKWEVFYQLHSKTTQSDMENILKKTTVSRKSLREFSPEELSDIKLFILREYKKDKPIKEIYEALKKNTNIEFETVKSYLKEIKKQLKIISRDKKSPKKASS